MALDNATSIGALVQTIGSAFLFVAVFSACVLTALPNQVERYAGVVMLGGLTFVFQSSLYFWCHNKGWVSLLVTTAWTTFWHALEMLLVSNVAFPDIKELVKQRQKPAVAGSKNSLSVWQLIVCTSALLCKWRRIGTKWQIPNPPRFSPDGSVPGKGKFLFWSLLKIAGSYLTMSIFSVAPPPNPDMIALQNREFFSRLDEITKGEAIFRVVSTAIFFINVALMVTMWYYLVCVVSVVLGLASPEDCPPFYGSLRNAYTLRGLWRNIHQGLRKCVSGPADAFAGSVLRLPRDTFASRCVRLVLAFSISAMIHAQADLAMKIPFAEAGQFYFFSVQALGIIFESAVPAICARAGIQFPQILQKGLGYIWVISWFCWITPTWSYTMMRHMDPVKDEHHGAKSAGGLRAGAGGEPKILRPTARIAGYIASGEEITGGVADYSEIFTVTKDLPLDDPRVVDKWPCHGPCPWPHLEMRNRMKDYMDYLGESGEKLLRLTEYGLGVPQGALTKMTQDGWHHMRVLRFPERNKTNGKGKDGRGIGFHTDYGLLVIAAQDHVGGLFVRPQYEDEKSANWQESSAGFNEDDDRWVYVPPLPRAFTVFPGDIMQYMTNSYLPSTPHKVGLNRREPYAFAYFHEPSFQAVARPLPGYEAGQEPHEGIHYGTHFTNTFMRNYPDRITSQHLLAEDHYQKVAKPALRTMKSKSMDEAIMNQATRITSAIL